MITKEIFQKDDLSNYTRKNITEKPNNAGEYTVTINGLYTWNPLTLNFDGENWLELEKMTELFNLSRIYYYT